MSHRRPDPRQAGLEQTLRRALRLAADSVDPSADGLDRIRAKISAGQPVHAQSVGWAGRAGWRTRYMTGLLTALAAAARYLEPAGIRIRYAYGAVAERFKPDLRAGGWIGWLRPAAALATGLLVVAGASWAIAGLPQVIASSSNSGPATTAGSGNNSSSPGQSGDGTPYGNGSTGGYSGNGSPHASPSCKAGPGSRSPSGSPSASGSPTPSPSGSSSPSPSPSPTTTPSDTSSPSPTGSPSTTPTSGALASGQGASGTDPASASPANPRPQISNPRTGQSGSSSPSASASPCG